MTNIELWQKNWLNYVLGLVTNEQGSATAAAIEATMTEQELAELNAIIDIDEKA